MARTAMRRCGYAICMAGLILLAHVSAGNAEPISIGGKKAVAMAASIGSNRDSTDISIYMAGSWIAPNGIFEGGFGLLVAGAGIGKDTWLLINMPSVTARVNTPLLGPEENMLFYLGGDVGVTLLIAHAAGATNSTTNVSGGPKIGFEYYMSPRTALQIQDSVTLQEGTAGNSIDWTNRVSVGFRVLFE